MSFDNIPTYIREEASRLAALKDALLVSAIADLRMANDARFQIIEARLNALENPPPEIVAPPDAVAAGYNKLTLDERWMSFDQTRWTPGYWWWDGKKSTNEDNGNYQWFRPEQVQTNATGTGGLKLIANRREPALNDGKPWVSGMVSGHDKIIFLGGFIEIRCRWTMTKAAWPCGWLLATDRNWPPEIDIFESEYSHFPYDVDKTQHGHFPADRSAPIQKMVSVSNPSSFHTYSLLWLPGVGLTYYIDGVKTFSTTSKVPNEPMYPLLSYAIGNSKNSNWAGSPDGTTQDGASLDCEYIRIWTK